MDMRDYEKILTLLDEAVQIADKAVKDSWEIDDKARFSRLRRELESARRPVRKLYYEFEDAVNVTRKGGE